MNDKTQEKLNAQSTMSFPKKVFTYSSILGVPVAICNKLEFGEFEVIGK